MVLLKHEEYKAITMLYRPGGFGTDCPDDYKIYCLKTFPFQIILQIIECGENVISILSTVPTFMCFAPNHYGFRIRPPDVQ